MEEELFLVLPILPVGDLTRSLESDIINRLIGSQTQLPCQPHKCSNYAENGHN